MLYEVITGANISCGMGGIPGAVNKISAEEKGGKEVFSFRITSYNVCYTKLLRLMKLASDIPSVTTERSRSLSELLYLTAAGISELDHIEYQLNQENSVRITSYNVCYTKLLRLLWAWR